MKPWIFGAVAGSIFVLADAVFAISPPSAYAFCLSCHVRDLVNTVSNAVIHTRFQVTEVAGRALLLTSPGVLLGAFLAARMSGEARPRKSDRPLLLAVLGFLMMTIGIVIFGCPTRIVLRAGYGEVYGIVALCGMAAGIAVATVLLRLRWGAGEMSTVLFSLVFLGIGLAVGFLAQRSRMCFVAGLRDWILVKDTELLTGLFSFLATVWLLTSVLTAFGLLHQGVPRYGATGAGGGEPGVFLRDVSRLSLSSLVNRFFFVTLAGGFLVGVFSVIAGGCVLRQHVLCAQGDRNALFYLVGFYGAVVVYYALLSRFFGWVYA